LVVRIKVSLGGWGMNLIRPDGEVREDRHLFLGYGEESTRNAGDKLFAVDRLDGHDTVLNQLAEKRLVIGQHADLTLGGLCSHDGGLAGPQHALYRHQFNGDFSHVSLPYFPVSFLYAASTSSKPPRPLKACSG